MSDRRNPFGNPPPSATPVSKPPDIYESLPVAEPRRRKRDWEREHQHEKVVYRGVDPKAALEVRKMAEELHVPTGEVARALLEYALDAYSRGDLNLDPRPNPERLRMTLFPSGNRPKHRQEKSLKGKQSSSETSWRVVTTWRNFSAELKHEIAILASEKGLHIPIGELVSAFLQFALRAYANGDLPLQPVEKVIGYKLAQEGDF
jgi:hypothetical protein